MRANSIQSVCLVAGFCLLAAGVVAAEAPKSGLAVGEAPAPFEVEDVTGPSAGKSICYRCKYGDEPVVSVFARDTSEMTVELIKALDGKLQDNKKLHGFVVLLTNDPAAATKDLQKVAKEAKIKNLPLTVFAKADGPQDYKIADNVKVTVLMWSGSKVKVNVSFKKGLHCEACVNTVLAELPKIVD